jgi:acylphosphatase
MVKERLHFFVFGLVQGVFYRASAKEKADELGVFGWVRNLPNGGVECVAEGEKETLVQFLRWARMGSECAAVEKIDVKWEKVTGEFSGFKIK